jgi:hypothetical protein
MDRERTVTLSCGLAAPQVALAEPPRLLFTVTVLGRMTDYAHRRWGAHLANTTRKTRYAKNDSMITA